MIRRLAALLVAALILSAAAGCGSSKPKPPPKPTPQEIAHDNGEALGQAAKQLVSAGSVSDVEAGVAALTIAFDNVRKNVKDQGGSLQRQIEADRTTLTKDFDDVKDAASSLDVGGLASATAQAQTDLSGVVTQAKKLASGSDSVAAAFWDGVQEGYGKG